MGEKEKHIEALIRLHKGLYRLAPGDDDLSNFILTLIPELPENPSIVDIGCGTGAGALMIARYYAKPVLAQDFSKSFLDELVSRADEQGIGHLIKTEQSDMNSLEWETASIDLLWSEGAAYNLGYSRAIKSWRPLLKDTGIAVISELNYFIDDVPGQVKSYWDEMYPDMGSENENLRSAESNGFDILGFHRLRSEAWWDNYYSPLKDRIQEYLSSPDDTMQAVIAETKEEMDMFESFSHVYGYTFYILGAC